MTPYLTKLFAACSPEWQTAQEIANAMGTRLPGPHITPALRRLERRGKLERDTAGTWDRWRVI